MTVTCHTTCLPGVRAGACRAACSDNLSLTNTYSSVLNVGLLSWQIQESRVLASKCSGCVNPGEIMNECSTIVGF